MGTIIRRKRADGSTAYMAQISIMRDRKLVFREAKTFDREANARAWLKKREAEIAKPGGLEAVQAAKSGKTLADIIDRYIAESATEMGRTKEQVLKAIKRSDLGAMRCEDIQSKDIVAYAAELRAGVKPQTVGNYLAHLGAVFAIARPAWGAPLDEKAMKDASTVAKRLGYTAKSDSRERRPSLDELDALMQHFMEVHRRRPRSAPMHVIIAFAIFSTRRLEEITRIAWADLDEAGSRILVRDMKHPGQKVGNDVWCDLPEPALRIIKARSRTDARIFPYTGDAISAAFTRAGQFLGIDDLNFHDLRHEGVSRLFEMGMNIPHAAAVSGHRSWTSLKRYTHLRQSGDKYAGWKWLDVVAPEGERNERR